MDPLKVLFHTEMKCGIGQSGKNGQINPLELKKCCTNWGAQRVGQIGWCPEPPQNSNDHIHISQRTPFHKPFQQELFMQWCTTLCPQCQFVQILSIYASIYSLSFSYIRQLREWLIDWHIDWLMQMFDFDFLGPIVPSPSPHTLVKTDEASILTFFSRCIIFLYVAFSFVKITFSQLCLRQSNLDSMGPIESILVKSESIEF